MKKNYLKPLCKTVPIGVQKPLCESLKIDYNKTADSQFSREVDYGSEETGQSSNSVWDD